MISLVEETRRALALELASDHLDESLELLQPADGHLRRRRSSALNQQREARLGSLTHVDIDQFLSHYHSLNASKNSNKNITEPQTHKLHRGGALIICAKADLDDWAARLRAAPIKLMVYTDSLLKRRKQGAAGLSANHFDVVLTTFDVRMRVCMHVKLKFDSCVFACKYLCVYKCIFICLGIAIERSYGSRNGMYRHSFIYIYIN